MTDLEKLKNTFNEIGVFYVEEIKEIDLIFQPGCQYVNIYPSKERESKDKKLGERLFGHGDFFEFCNGKLASY